MRAHTHTHTQIVARLRVYTPALATAAVVMIVGSMLSTNVDVVSRSGFTIITAVLTLHSAGFALGYGISKALGLSDRIARTNSIEVRRGNVLNGGGVCGTEGGEWAVQGRGACCPASLQQPHM